MHNPGKLLILPCVIADEPLGYLHLPVCLENYIEQTHYFMVENVRTARRFIKKILPTKDIDSITFHEIDKHEYDADYKSFLKSHINNGHNIGLLSESGTASVGDPGYYIVNQAQELNIEIHPVAGPSSIIQALSASGLNGQIFSFQGYLPIDEKDKVAKIKQLETLCSKSTQIFIEAPYRNNKLIDYLIKNCFKNTKLCIARNISGENQYIITKKISDWKRSKTPDCHKIATIFILGV